MYPIEYAFCVFYKYRGNDSCPTISYKYSTVITGASATRINFGKSYSQYLTDYQGFLNR
jgi:hypothetical protein